MSVNSIVETAVKQAYSSNPNLFSSINESTLTSVLVDAIVNAVPKELDLSKVSPDYEAVVLQLTSILSENEAWSELVTASTGQAIVRMVASGIAYGQFSIERALQEAFPHTASSSESQYAATEMLGVRIKRNTPAKVSVRLTRTAADTFLEISSLSKFTILNTSFFNRKSVIFEVGQLTVETELHQGTINTVTTKATGADNFELVVGTGNKNLSDTDVYVYINDIEWSRSTEEPWKFKRNELIWLDTTLPNGNVSIRFGDGIYGKVPPLNSSITVKWVSTNGAASNNVEVDQQVSYSDGQSVVLQGNTIDRISGGADMHSPDFYVLNASNLYASNRKVVRKVDYITKALEYPGVKDALFRGQSELGPKRRSLMNVVGVTVLMEDGPINQYEWSEFIEYISERGNPNLEYVKLDPVPVDVVLTASVYCMPSASLSQVRQYVIENVNKLFSPKQGYIGYSIYRSDIHDTLEGKNILGGLIDYVTVTSPTVDLVMPTPYHYARLKTFNLTVNYSNRVGYLGRNDVENA